MSMNMVLWSVVNGSTLTEENNFFHILENLGEQRESDTSRARCGHLRWEKTRHLGTETPGKKETHTRGKVGDVSTSCSKWKEFNNLICYVRVVYVDRGIYFHDFLLNNVFKSFSIWYIVFILLHSHMGFSGVCSKEPEKEKPLQRFRQLIYILVFIKLTRIMYMWFPGSRANMLQHLHSAH